MNRFGDYGLKPTASHLIKMAQESGSAPHSLMATHQRSTVSSSAHPCSRATVKTAGSSKESADMSA